MSSLRLYDTLTRTHLPVTAEDGTQVRFYCCGPTVYGPAHIGNFRTFVVQDLFRRVIESTGQPTRHVRNVTDVDDKTIREANRLGQSLGDFTGRWLERFHADADALGCLRPHVEPSAVAHIDDQVRLIETLIAKGIAYVSPDGSVYYAVAKFPPYGRLSHLDQRELRHGAGGPANDSDEYEKASVADFALWKARKPEDGNNYWNSPWGEGRPGWHLECSAMSLRYLGEGFDVHSGGIDLCFPHHENEIAQSEAATGKTFARHWFHVAHLMVEGGKMSKSLGNLYTLEDIRARGFGARELRYLLLSGSYRQPLNFTFEGLHAARQALQKLERFQRALESDGKEAPTVEPEGPIRPFDPVRQALLDDLNAPAALGQLFTTIRNLEKDLPEMTAPQLTAVRDDFDAILAIFGFSAADPSLPRIEIPAAIEALAAQRWDAKKARDFATADQLRDQIAAAGWVIHDGPDAYRIEKKSALC